MAGADASTQATVEDDVLNWDGVYTKKSWFGVGDRD